FGGNLVVGEERGYDLRSHLERLLQHLIVLSVFLSHGVPSSPVISAAIATPYIGKWAALSR
ncbi:MAG: hypothetical protein K2P95_00190, partial [Hyphomonadaceae bacterium]|nr:hypothetical protein [Hyphomonadaceae bacterium]